MWKHVVVKFYKYIYAFDNYLCDEGMHYFYCGIGSTYIACNWSTDLKKECFNLVESEVSYTTSYKYTFMY